MLGIRGDGLPRGHVVVKNLPADAKRNRFDPWVGKIPWRRKRQPLKYSRLENPTDRGDWQAYSP